MMFAKLQRKKHALWWKRRWRKGEGFFPVLSKVLVVPVSLHSLRARERVLLLSVDKKFCEWVTRLPLALKQTSSLYSFLHTFSSIDWKDMKTHAHTKGVITRLDSSSLHCPLNEPFLDEMILTSGQLRHVLNLARQGKMSFSILYRDKGK